MNLNLDAFEEEMKHGNVHDITAFDKYPSEELEDVDDNYIFEIWDEFEGVPIFDSEQLLEETLIEVESHDFGIEGCSQDIYFFWSTSSRFDFLVFLDKDVQVVGPCVTLVPTFEYSLQSS